MSRFSTLFSAVARPHLLHHHGETVTRYPLGVEASAASVTGIFNEEEPEKSTGNAEEVIRKGTLRVSDSTSLDLKDQWLIRSERWQTAAKRSAVAGFVVLELWRREKISTKRVDGGRLL